jgi:hypothetical protein
MTLVLYVYCLLPSQYLQCEFDLFLWSRSTYNLRPHRTSVIAIVNDGLKDVQHDGEEEPADDGGVDRHHIT